MRNNSEPTQEEIQEVTRLINEIAEQPDAVQKLKFLNDYMKAIIAESKKEGDRCVATS